MLSVFKIQPANFEHKQQNGDRFVHYIGKN